MAAALRGEPQLKLQLAIGGGRLWNRLHCCWRSGTLPFSCASRFLHRIFTAARRHSSCVPPTNNITRSPTTAPTRGSLSKKSANTKHAQNGVCSGPPNQESRGLLVPFDSCTVCGECRVVIYLRPNARAARIGPWSNNNNLHIAAGGGHTAYGPPSSAHTSLYECISNIVRSPLRSRVATRLASRRAGRTIDCGLGNRIRISNHRAILNISKDDQYLKFSISQSLEFQFPNNSI